MLNFDHDSWLDKNSSQDQDSQSWLDKMFLKAKVMKKEINLDNIKLNLNANNIGI